MFSETDLEGYLDEALSADAMAEIEKALRATPELLQELAVINAQRDAGAHTLGAIWRRNRLSCPDRTVWGNYLLGALADDEADFYRHHLETVGCRFCQANVDDLRKRQAAASSVDDRRRRRYFKSSVGELSRRRKS